MVTRKDVIIAYPDQIAKWAATIIKPFDKHRWDNRSLCLRCGVDLYEYKTEKCAPALWLLSLDGAFAFAEQTGHRHTACNEVRRWAFPHKAHDKTELKDLPCEILRSVLMEME